MRGYVIAAAALAFLAVGAVAFKYRGDAIAANAERDRVEAELATALDANRSLEAALLRSREQAAINDRVMRGVAQELAKINGSIAGATAALRNLEDSNEEVRAYLGGLVPPAVELQLNR